MLAWLQKAEAHRGTGPQIDALVYKLYELTEEEIGIVESA
jgi:hypothetical protein